MGFANHDAALVPSMVAAGVLQHRVFAMCFAYTGGNLVLGGDDARLHTEEMVYTPMKSSGNSWYVVNVNGVRIGSESIGDTAAFNTGKGTIVDSGTTDTYLPRAVASAFQAAFKRASGFDYITEHTYRFSDDEIAALPSVYYELE
jgi:hypothetical protein